MRCGSHSVWVQWIQKRDSSTPTCVTYPRVCVYKSESERVGDRDSGAGDVCVYMPCSRVMPLLVRLHFFVASLTGSYSKFHQADK